MKEQTEKKLAIIFNEWDRRYTENPEWFEDIITEDGVPCTDYGKEAAHYFIKLAVELGEIPLLRTIDGC